ncbi:response regulator [Pseudosulfitobacter koreensis]|uniref:Response regulator n=1 Tax=Pseudosulfitobacter koreensis TaxID=2968472 RepID=A0ABT1YYQ8_9RHOB|nr:response regulator [Pseudosulfitobacter koreense]MCR8826024.1 response regulator [Pseudosulfitobacter koreense]
MTQVATQILLVEDDPAISKLIVQFLKGDGAEVIASSNPERARQILSERTDFDLVIVDFLLGEVTAVALMDELRIILRDVPVVIISGGNPMTDLETTQAIADLSGAVAFLQKPFRKAELLDAVATSLK